MAKSAKTLLKDYPKIVGWFGPNQTFNKGSHDSHKNSTPMNKKIIQVSKIYKPVNAKSSNIISDVSKNKEYVKNFEISHFCLKNVNINIVEDRERFDENQRRSRPKQ